MEQQTEMTIPDMIRAYNAKVAQATEIGLQGYRPRKAFHHRADAQTHLEDIENSIRAFRNGHKAQPEPQQAEQTEEQTMPTKKKAKRASNGNGKSKTEAIAHLLTRSSGCTAKQVLELTGWPSVSMPAMAKACGLKLTKDKKKGEVTRYYGA